MAASNKVSAQPNQPPASAGASTSTLFPYNHPNMNFKPVTTEIERQFNDFERSTGRPSALSINDSEWSKFTATLGGKYSESDLDAAKEQTETDDAFTLESTFAEVQGGNGKGFSEDDLKTYLNNVAPDLGAGVATQVEDLARHDKTLIPGPATGKPVGG